MEATNIDNDQIAHGVSGGPGLDARHVNRLERFRDFNADVGGYLNKSKAWWYGAYRSTAVAQRYPWLLDTAATLTATVGTGKVTYRLSPRQKLVGYLQYETFKQSSYFVAGTSQPISSAERAIAQCLVVLRSVRARQRFSASPLAEPVEEPAAVQDTPPR